MTHSFYRKAEETPAHQYKKHLLVREGYMTSRHGYPAVELGYPMVVREDLPEHRFRDGTQMGPVFHNPEAPYNKHEDSKGNHAPRYHHILEGEKGRGHTEWTPRQVLDVMYARNDSFKNGHYYPYKRNHNMHYESLPQGDWEIPLPDPSNFHHKSDELRKWLFGLR